MTDTGLPPEFQARIQPQLDRAEKARIIWRILAGAVAIVIVVLLSITLVRVSDVVHAIRAQQQTNSPKVDQTKRAAEAAAQGLHILEDCLNPGGVCFRKNQTNQADILRQVTNIFIYVQLCTNDSTMGRSLHATQQCVATLEREADARQP